MKYALTRQLSFTSLSTTIGLCVILGACSSFTGRSPTTSELPLRIVVGPVILEPPLPESTDIHSFSESPSPEAEPAIARELVDEVQLKAQRFLTEELARYEGLAVVPFNETRRTLPDVVAPQGKQLTPSQIDALASATGADIVVTGLIHDYGRVRWQYWVTGWLLHVSVATTIIGVATGWNPAAIGAYLAFDATTDFPLWYGGAYIFGWAFRPVRVHAEAMQIKNCRGIVWSEDELVVKVPGKTLAEYPPEQQSKREIQLEANLRRVMADIAETIGPKLALQACQNDGTPEKISTFSVWSIFDLLY